MCVYRATLRDEFNQKVFPLALRYTRYREILIGREVVGSPYHETRNIALIVPGTV